MIKKIPVKRQESKKPKSQKTQKDQDDREEIKAPVESSKGKIYVHQIVLLSLLPNFVSSVKLSAAQLCL
jgi:hypothetical protein